MTKFFNKFKKPGFWPIFPDFWGKKKKKKIPKNLALSHTISFGFLAPCQNLEKNNDTIQRKCPDIWKDGETLIYRTLRATTGGPKNTYMPLEFIHLY